VEKDSKKKEVWSKNKAETDNESGHNEVIKKVK
jgi:hypothetical protein